MSAPVRARRRRTALLGELVALMTTEGLSGATLDEVAERLRCSKSTLYALAGSKQELLVRVTREYFRRATEEVERALAAETDPRQRVVTYLEAVAEQLRPLSKHFHDDLMAVPAAGAVYRLNTAAAADRIRGLIVDGTRAGVFREVNAHFLGEIIASGMFAIQRGDVAARLDLTDAEAYSELASLLLFSLRPEAAPPVVAATAPSAESSPTSG